MEHRVTSIEDKGWPLIRVTCSCGYWQQTRRLAFFESLWLTDEIHLLWAEQNGRNA
jgi:hypothetical protein